VLSSPTIITHIAYSLHGAISKLRTLASDVLAAVSVLSPPAGHRVVLSALSDYRVAYDETFRFENLVAFLHPADDENGFTAEPDEATWEAQTATMTLINALTNCPDALEDRIALREEFGRRGLNEAIVVRSHQTVFESGWANGLLQTLRYIRPPDNLLTQLDVYTEEKTEDEEDMRERMQNLMKREAGQRTLSETEALLQDLVHATEDDDNLNARIIDVLKHTKDLLLRDIDESVVANHYLGYHID
jgi:diaphanous 1